ncbi:unnamed protein product [Dracunculus medinensis]|uniref:G_PROTEIN_RECEP_F1_2 domain-containing protein n=1 Tax=Dracunculus medinensis TaxID=318479 RepID=A0A158Q6I7_DRAME|nr:unnamed protein product [Dracunculus medinensis]
MEKELNLNYISYSNFPGSNLKIFFFQVNNLHWNLAVFICQLYCALDVAASSSSIIHLVLISIDRLIAATRPADYKATEHKRRIYFAIVIAWIFSTGISIPVGADFSSRMREFVINEHLCGIYSSKYIFYSSILSFYLPCCVMIVTYSYIFYVLRRRLRSVKLQHCQETFQEMAGGHFFGFGADLGNIATSAVQKATGVESENRKMISWEKPLLQKIEETKAEHASSLDDSDREHLETILDAATSDERSVTSVGSVVLDAITTVKEEPKIFYKIFARTDVKVFFHLIVFGKEQSNLIASSFALNNGVTSNFLSLLSPLQSHASKMRRLSDLIASWERSGRSSISEFSRMYTIARRESLYIARKKLAGMKDWALNLAAKLRMKQGISLRKEARATKLVAVVMLVFLCCWLPFFIMNMIKAYMLNFDFWPTYLEIWFHWFTALGYLNSSLNFFIYFAINEVFNKY